MKFRDDAHALRAARRMEIETIKLINFILIMLSEPVVRARERIVFELHIRRSKWKPDQPLSDFGNAIRSGMLHQWRIPKRERLVRNRIHVSALNCAVMRTNRSPKPYLRKGKNRFGWRNSVKRRLFRRLCYCECFKKRGCYQRYLAENIYDWSRNKLRFLNGCAVN